MLPLQAALENNKIPIDSFARGVYLAVKSPRAMKKQIDLVMFDLDGTLAATGRDLANSVNYIRSALRLDPLDDKLVYSHVGRGVEHLLRMSLPENSQDRFKEIMELFLKHYAEHLLDTTALYPHVRETLEYFEKKKRVVVSNKLHRLTVPILRGLGIEACFDAVLGGDSAAEKKPHPGALNRVLADFRIEPARGLIVGDGDADIEAGRGAGVHTCGVTYGLGRKEELVAARPDYLIDDLSELEKYFY